MKQAIVFGTERTGYGIDQIHSPMTVGQLKELLEDLDDDTLVICSHDSGYTYGTLSRQADIRIETEDGEYETVDTLWA